MCTCTDVYMYTNSSFISIYDVPYMLNGRKKLSGTASPKQAEGRGPWPGVRFPGHAISDSDIRLPALGRSGLIRTNFWHISQEHMSWDICQKLALIEQVLCCLRFGISSVLHTSCPLLWCCQTARCSHSTHFHLMST